MLEQGYSVNLYMFHGGTSFGWMNGATSTAGKYEPDVTSYDYDVPVSESGELRPEVLPLFRDVIRKVTGNYAARSARAHCRAGAASVQFTQRGFHLEHAAKADKSPQILSMEDVGQSYGYILYRTNIAQAQSGDLHIDELHSYAQDLSGRQAGRHA
jgi:beta-galactosidase